MESIEDWLFWSRKAASLLNIASALAKDVPSEREDWEPVITTESEEKPLLIEALISRPWIARMYLQEAVNLWLRVADVHLSLGWSIDGSPPSLQLEAETFGVLGVQLLTAMTSAQGLAVCDGCAKPYVRVGRRPQSGRANFCPNCRAGKVPGRLRQRRRRAKTNLND